MENSIELADKSVLKHDLRVHKQRDECLDSIDDGRKSSLNLIIGSVIKLHLVRTRLPDCGSRHSYRLGLSQVALMLGQSRLILHSLGAFLSEVICAGLISFIVQLVVFTLLERLLQSAA